jgi:hypothetical protein
MPSETWTVSAVIDGEFYLESQDSRRGGSQMVEGLERLQLEPEDGPWTGRHTLTASVRFDKAEDEELDSQAIYERGKQLVQRVAALASIGAGRPVRWYNLSVTRRTGDDPPRIDTVSGAERYAEVAPPAPLPVDVFSGSLDSKIVRIIRWWSRGIATLDAVDRLVALNNATDLIAGMATGIPGRVRRCSACGHEEAIGPGLRERVVAFLTSNGIDEDIASDVYESRTDLSHARTELDEDDMRRFRDHARILAEAVRTGVARELGLTLPPIPIPLPVDGPSAVLHMQAIGESDAQAREGDAEEPAEPDEETR